MKQVICSFNWVLSMRTAEFKVDLYRFLRLDCFDPFVRFRFSRSFWSWAVIWAFAVECGPLAISGSLVPWGFGYVVPWAFTRSISHTFWCDPAFGLFTFRCDPDLPILIRSDPDSFDPDSPITFMCLEFSLLILYKFFVLLLEFY
jgi:hypothetical protein